MRDLHSAPKGYTADGDKLCSPVETVARVKARFAEHGGILAESRRTDTGRLGIPVYLSLCGPAARAVMPTRKQMGKGASPEQAEASAVMELAERFSFFSFWADEANFTPATWTQAQALWPGRVIPLGRILASVGDTLSETDAARLMDLVTWRFVPARDVARGRDVMVPLDLFKKLNEFNGSSAGNCLEESLLQGACELVERHVSALADRDHPLLPTIDPRSVADPVLAGLIGAFEKNGVTLILKDMSLGLPVPTVAALAHDPATFPSRSEIVFTAGTAASPVKAAVRAVTEIAQLAGDFETGSTYEASGLGKFESLEETAWVRRGPVAPLSSLPDIEAADMLDELLALARGLAERGFPLYCVETTHPTLGVAANYSFVPGFQFRERTPRASLGMFVGRILAEECPLDRAEHGLTVLAEVAPEAAWLPFYQGLLDLRREEPLRAMELFARAEPLQADPEETALTVFYQAYAASLLERWDAVETLADRAIALSPDVKEYHNLRGVARFKARDFARAAGDFEAALRLDSGSAMDLANLGLCHKFMGHREAAAEFLGKALEMEPGLDFARKHLDELRLKSD